MLIFWLLVVDIFLLLSDINLIFCRYSHHVNTLCSHIFFWNPTTQTSPTSLPAKKFSKWRTSAKIVRFGWNLVCKSVLRPDITLKNFVGVRLLFCCPVQPTYKQTHRENFKHLKLHYFWSEINEIWHAYSLWGTELNHIDFIGPTNQKSVL